MKTTTDVLSGLLAFIAIVALICILLGLPLMLLWNWLMPELFNLPQIDFWQAVGLQLLATLLFKNTNTSSKKD